MEYKLLCGDVVEQLRVLPSNSVNACVTSPPYYGLRDYGNDRQIGLEKTPEEYIKNLVNAFREVKRVLRDDGTLWINIGDSYSRSHGNGCKPKDLIGIPWLLAFALRKDGWYLRQDIIWAKNNPVPESVKDRCTKSHEYIFMLAKSKKYYFDHDVMQENADPRSSKRYEHPFFDKAEQECPRPNNGHNTPGILKFNGKKNKRDVWQVSVCSSVKEAHFAVFPKKN